jgi:hypothetical protein
MKDETLLIQGIPIKVKASFKAACAKQGKTMKQIVILFMQEFVKRR